MSIGVSGTIPVLSNGYLFTNHLLHCCLRFYTDLWSRWTKLMFRSLSPSLTLSHICFDFRHSTVKEHFLFLLSLMDKHIVYLEQFSLFCLGFSLSPSRCTLFWQWTFQYQANKQTMKEREKSILFLLTFRCLSPFRLFSYFLTVRYLSSRNVQHSSLV